MIERKYTSQEVVDIVEDAIAVSKMRSIAEVMGSFYGIAATIGSLGMADDSIIDNEKAELQKEVLEKIVKSEIYDGAIARLESRREQFPELIVKTLDPLYKLFPNLRSSDENTQ